jgi:hypothetical protein
MAGASNRFPPLYVAACIIFSVGVAGLGCIFVLQLPPYIFEGLLYIFLGLIAFGIGENINHPKALLITTSENSNPDSRQFHRKRNACSLGNLIDIGALLLFSLACQPCCFLNDSRLSTGKASVNVLDRPSHSETTSVVEKLAWEK